MTISPLRSKNATRKPSITAVQQACSGGVFCQSRHSLSSSMRHVPVSNCAGSAPRNAAALPSSLSRMRIGPFSIPSPKRSVLPDRACFSASLASRSPGAAGSEGSRPMSWKWPAAEREPQEPPDRPEVDIALMRRAVDHDKIERGHHESELTAGPPREKRALRHMHARRNGALEKAGPPHVAVARAEIRLRIRLRALRGPG